MEKAKLFAVTAHGDQLYGEYPYLIHLGFVNYYVNKYKYLLENDSEIQLAVTAGWLHDTIEDCPSVNYEKIKSEFGEEVANTVRALTNVDGIYNLEGLKNNRIAYFVKLCDRLANVSFLEINFKEKAYNKYVEQFESMCKNSPSDFTQMIEVLNGMLDKAKTQSSS